MDQEARQESRYGHKNHISNDNVHKLIRRYAVTGTSVHDGQVFDDVLDEENGDRSIWADSAYRSQAREEQFREQGYNGRIRRRAVTGANYTSRSGRPSIGVLKVRACDDDVRTFPTMSKGNEQRG